MVTLFFRKVELAVLLVLDLVVTTECREKFKCLGVVGWWTGGLVDW